MASFVARQAVGSLRAGGRAGIICRRAIHLTPVVQKKKSKVVIEDLFGDDGIVEDLIQQDSAKPKSSTAMSQSTTPIASTSTIDPASLAAAIGNTEAQQPKKKKLLPEVRLERFNQICDFVTPRLGRRPAVKTPEVRKSAWVNLVGLAASEEQLTKVTEMFPGWKESGHQFDPQFSELFVRRCEELSCPLLALKVYGNYSKYNIHLTLTAARQLLHSLHAEHPIDTVMTASALFNVYSLPPISQDLISCSMLICACYKHSSRESIQVADALVPHLQEMLKKTKPIKVSDNPMEKALDKPSVWVKWTLKKVDRALFVKNGERADWLSVWRAKSGHIPNTSKF